MTHVPSRTSWIPVLLALSACSSPVEVEPVAAPTPAPVEATRAPEPAATVEPTPFAVALHLRTEPTLRLRVEVAMTGEDDGETPVGVAESWGGIGPDRTDLVEPAARDSAGEPLDLARGEGHRWVVSHAPGERFTVSAWLEPNDLRRAFHEHYRPILEPGLFHGIGHLLLPMPDHLEWETGRPVELSFHGFDEAGWQVVCSFGIGSDPMRLHTTLGKLRSALFVAGHVDVHEREIAGSVLAVSHDATDWRFEGDELADLVTTIVTMEREFMDDFDKDFYWVNAISVGRASERGFSFGGTGLTNAFALFLQPDTDIGIDSSSSLPVRKLLAHECFHEWNGIQIRLADPEEACYWFSEGFTDYFARRILHEAGWLDDEAYAASLSETLSDYHTSPFRNAPADELAKLFWEDRKAQQQPYRRGDVVAMLLDHEIRTRSKGESDLGAVMRDLLAESRATGKRYDAEALLERFEPHVGPGATDHLRAIVVGGATARLPSDAFGPDFTVETSEAYAFDAGFDVDASIEARKVIGVREGSLATDAGLEEGMPMVSWSVYHDDPTRQMTLQVRRSPDAPVETIAYAPKGDATSVPVVRVRNGD